MNILSEKAIENYKKHLINEEKSKDTIEKYIRDLTGFKNWLGDREISKCELLEYKERLTEKYAPASVNSVIASLNGFFAYIERFDLKLKNLKIQRQIFASRDKELTKAEYERLLNAAKAKNNERLYLIMQTICSTGIRVSELKAITIESVKSGSATINCKGKMRMVILPKQLCKILKRYIADKKISTGSVFVSKNGKPLDRSNIWSDMKKLCESAGV